MKVQFSPMAAFSAAGRSLVPIWDAFDPRQIGWQGPAHGLAFRRSAAVSTGRIGRFARRRRRGQLRLQFGDQRFQFRLVKQRQLFIGDAIGAWAKALALQQCDIVEQLLDALGMLGTRALRFRQLLGQLRDEPLKNDGVVG